jgi:uncharacterized protein (DUF4415 family)
MEKVVSMTAEEIRKNFDVKKAIAMIKTAPEFDDPNPNGKVIARGLAEFREYIKNKANAKSKDKEVVVEIRFRESAAKKLRATGRGWQTRVRDYLMDGLAKGKLSAPSQ